MSEKNNNPKITVITPTYNRANLIVETIQSILAQDFLDFEYLILDDGSTDNTKEVIKPYLTDKRVQYLYRENSGEAETVNWGWSLAKGEYFTQVNSDDPILPNLFSEMVKALDENPKVVLAYPDFYFIDEAGNRFFETKNPSWNFLQALSEFSCYATSAGTFLRRNAFKNRRKLKNKRFKYINDIEMYWEMALEGDFLHIPQFLATWRSHASSISAERYKSIPEIEVWFKDFFSKPNLPLLVLECKPSTAISICKHSTQLLKKADLPFKEKLKRIVSHYKNQITNNDFHFIKKIPGFILEQIAIIIIDTLPKESFLYKLLKKIFNKLKSILHV